MGSGKRRSSSEHKSLLKPIVGLTENLPAKDLEFITIQAIREHRRLRDEAEALGTSYTEQALPSGDSGGPARLSWISAMIRMHAQQTVVSTLLDILGYVPEVPAE